MKHEKLLSILPTAGTTIVDVNFLRAKNFPKVYEDILERKERNGEQIAEKNTPSSPLPKLNNKPQQEATQNTQIEKEIKRKTSTFISLLCL